GIAGVLFSILYRNHEFRYDTWNRNKKQIHQVFTNMGEAGFWATSPEPLAPIALETIPEIESYSYFSNYYSSNVIEYKDKKSIVSKCFNADEKIFEMFPFEFVEGDPKVALKDKESVVISDELASELFGNEKNLVGKTIRINNSNLTLKGVYRIPGKSSVAPKLIFNRMLTDLEYNKGQWGNFNFGLIFKLKKDVDKSI